MSKYFRITSPKITKERTRRIYFSVQKISDAVLLAEVRETEVTYLERRRE
jgi:hypothetical protein